LCERGEYDFGAKRTTTVYSVVAASRHPKCCV
jgi:hypothetical protein